MDPRLTQWNPFSQHLDKHHVSFTVSDAFLEILCMCFPVALKTGQAAHQDRLKWLSAFACQALVICKCEWWMLADNFLPCDPFVQQFDFLLNSLSGFRAVYHCPGMDVRKGIFCWSVATEYWQCLLKHFIGVILENMVWHSDHTWCSWWPHTGKMAYDLLAWILVLHEGIHNKLSLCYHSV